MQVKSAANSSDFKISACQLLGDVTVDDSEAPGAGHLFHACEIDGIPSIVHPVDMAASDPVGYQRLTAFAHQYGLRLQPERRQRSDAVHQERRRPWLPILLLTISAGFAHAGENDAQWSARLNFSQPAQTEINEDDTRFATATSQLPVRALDEVALYTPLVQTLLQTLRRHWQPTPEDPVSLDRELQLMAVYYSEFPEVVDLLFSLDELDWGLQYQPRTFRTEVTGTALSVKNATVFFDPNFGARLKFQRACNEKLAHCIASPADALLHEFLHARSILKNTQKYIEQGGMGGLLYPFEHEREMIREENALYRAMTAIDMHPRPIRHEHTGRYVLVACSTCIQ